MPLQVTGMMNSIGNVISSFAGRNAESEKPLLERSNSVPNVAQSMDSASPADSGENRKPGDASEPTTTQIRQRRVTFSKTRSRT